MLQRMAVRLGWVAGAILWTAAAHAQENAPLMAAIFGDHVVLQRDRPIDVWGQAKPGEQVTVSLAGAARSAQADAQGRWAVTLPTLTAGGPHALSARTATRQQNVTDVKIGDVWLCSGQSNMEWVVRNALNADWEIQHSANDNIRHVAIPRFAAVTPRADFPAPLEWKVAGPNTTQYFSAVCYYFMRELQKTVNVPQGIINASWGGTRIETWLSAPMLRQLGGNDAALDLLGEFVRDRAAAAVSWGKQWQQWWTSQPATAGIQPWAAVAKTPTGSWQRAPAPLTTWESWGNPKLSEYDGLLWYRAQVKLTAAQAKQAATISLGVIDDVDLVWINGRAMANGFGEEERTYTVPAGLLKAGDNLIVVSDFDMWGSGGIHGAGQALHFADGSSVPLAEWDYQLPPPGLSAPRAPWEPIAGINILYNGMIAPLGRFGLRGVAWYQGEANGGLDDAKRYQQQLQGLFTDWRRQFESPLPFLVVQLANWGALATAPVDSGWARLREAQRRAVTADGNAALAITIDIGNRDDIHPTNKQDVGKRLARAARQVAYGEKLSAFGAQPVSARRAVTGVDVVLGEFAGDLRVIGARDPAGFELCGATQETCHFVRAELRAGGTVHLEDAAPGAATRVRFCWADSPLCNLYDGAGLPVGPFELSIE